MDAPRQSIRSEVEDRGTMAVPLSKATLSVDVSVSHEYQCCCRRTTECEDHCPMFCEHVAAVITVRRELPFMFIASSALRKVYGLICVDTLRG